MATSIECFIPKEKEYTIEEIGTKIKTVYERLKVEYLRLENDSPFIRETNGDWWLKRIKANKKEPEYLLGEGDGFSITIYKNVINISCIERIGNFYRDGAPLSAPLYKILTALSKEFRDSNQMLIAPGGMGDTDRINDMAYYEDASFDTLCEEMQKSHGTPATALNQLSEKIWFFQD